MPLVELRISKVLDNNTGTDRFVLESRGRRKAWKELGSFPDQDLAHAYITALRRASNITKSEPTIVHEEKLEISNEA